MQNTEVKGLLSQLRSAAGAIKEQIQEADRQIAELNAQRRALTDSPVSKADFMGFVRADIAQRAGNYPYRVKKWARNNKFPFSFAQLERFYTSGKLQPFPYLDGETPHDAGEIDPGALYWHFGDLIAEKFSDVLDIFEWSDELMPVSERRTRIAEIDIRLAEIQAQRSEWANDLISSGMYE
jgi:hypothetical protein